MPDDARVGTENDKACEVENTDDAEMLPDGKFHHLIDVKIEPNGICQQEAQSDQQKINDQDDPSGDQTVSVMI